MTERLAGWFRRNTGIVTLAVMLLVQGGATIWWTAVLSQRVTTVETQVARNTVFVDKIPVMEQTDKQVLSLLEKISADVCKLGDRLWEHNQATAGKK